MKDRNVEFPNRFRMTKVEGTDDIYDLIPAPGEVIALGDTFSKANMLPDEIPKKLGLSMPNPQVKDALGVLADIGNLHVWERVQTYADPVPEVPAGYTLGAVEADKNIVINTYGSNAVWYQTASSVSVDGSGNVSLVSPSSATYFYVENLTSSGMPTLWAGKFVLITSLINDNQYALPKGTIFFVPSDGKLKASSNQSIVYVTKLQRVTGYPYTPAIPAGTTTDYLTSTDPNAYPKQSAEGGQDASYVLGDVQSLSIPLGSNTNIAYTSSLSVADDGSISTSGWTNGAFSTSGSSVTSPDLTGKYVKFSHNTQGNLGMWYIPSDSVASVANQYVTYTKAQKVTGHPAIPANTVITYLGQLGEPGARIEVGSYVGTGTYGYENWCSISFSSVPKMVFLGPGDVYGGVVKILWPGATKAGSYYNSSSLLSLTWRNGNKTVSWCSTNSAEHQCNTSGKTYYVYAMV